MPQELRVGFHRDLDKLDISLAALLALIPDTVRSATAALLGGDESQAAELDRWRVLIDDLYADVEQTAETLVARQAPLAGDLRFLFACVRLVPQLYGAVDLVADIAAPARAALAGEFGARVSELISDLGEATAECWIGVANLWERRELSLLDEIAERDDAIAELRSTLTAEAATGALGVPVAMEIALIGRSYERLGRHAVLAARRIEPVIPLRREAT